MSDTPDHPATDGPVDAPPVGTPPTDTIPEATGLSAQDVINHAKRGLVDQILVAEVRGSAENIALSARSEELMSQDLGTLLASTSALSRAEIESAFTGRIEALESAVTALQGAAAPAEEPASEETPSDDPAAEPAAEPEVPAEPDVPADAETSAEPETAAEPEDAPAEPDAPTAPATPDPTPSTPVTPTDATETPAPVEATTSALSRPDSILDVLSGGLKDAAQARNA